MADKTIQRTIVLSCGRAADDVADRLNRILAAPGEPGAVVASVSLSGGELTKRLREAAMAVSRLDGRRELARAGWRLDRLDELGLLVLLDLSSEPTAAIAAVREARVVARQALGSDAAALLIAISPSPGDDTALAVLRRASVDNAFGRGVVLLGPVNRDGLLLEGEAFGEAVATLAHALLTTPMRDVPEGVAVTLGVAVWRWPRHEVQAALARRWAAGAIGQWLEQAEGDFGAQSAGWLERRELSPEQLAAAAANIAPPAITPSWSPPQPWAMRRALDRVTSTLTVLAAPSTEQVVALEAALAATWEGSAQGVEDACRAMLDKQPAGSVSRAGGWLEGLAAEMTRLADRAAARQEREDVTAADLAQRETGLRTALARLLVGWPGNGARAWAERVWRIWRWPEMALTYWRLHQTGEALAELSAARANLTQQQAVTAALLRGYEAWARRLGCLAGRLDEVEAMLRFLLRHLLLPEEDKEISALHPVAPHALYTQLMESAAAEAEWAAVAVGGLGRQTIALDDTIGDALPAAGAKRLADIERLPAVAALRFAAEGGADVTDWWATLWADAAPLWPAGQAGPAAATTGPQTETLYVLSAGASALRALLNLPESAEGDWIETGDETAITVIRAVSAR